MALKQQMKQQMRQNLSPQQLQVIKLLEYSVLELEEKIKHELEENPALEEGGEIEEHDDLQLDREDNIESADENIDSELDDYLPEDDIADYKIQSDNYSPDDNKQSDFSYSDGITFIEYLSGQLHLMQLSDRQKKLGDYIIGNIDEEGYMRREVAQIVDDINVHIAWNVTETEIFEALSNVQSLEPAGVGARYLEECLLLQLQRKPLTESLDNAMRIVEECFDEFGQKHYDRICKELNITDEQLKAAADEILKLNPKPGNAFIEAALVRSADAITPDFIYDCESDTLSLNNRNIPDLHVSREYRQLFEDYTGNPKNKTAAMKDAVNFAKQKLDSAKSFIDAIKQRDDTLLRVMRSIIQYQKKYFCEGDESLLKPMTMKEIADKSDCDVSTVSRVSGSKYIQTDFGLFSLKHFFTEGLMTDSGEEISTREIKRILQTCIEEEDKSRPLADEKLCDILQKKGFLIARRTVAKYREQLGLPVARLRKKI